MPLQVVGKGYSWVNRFAELDALAKGQLRWLAIEAGKVLREQVEAEGLVDSGLLRQKIGQARMVDEYLWVVPAFSEVGDPAQPAPRGTIREFLEWYRGEREREREGRAKATERRRKAIAAERRQETYRPKYVKRVLAGRSRGSRLTIRELEIIESAYHSRAATVVGRARAARQPAGKAGVAIRYISAAGRRAGLKVGKTRATQARLHIRRATRTLRMLRTERDVFSRLIGTGARRMEQIRSLYDPEIAELEKSIGTFRSDYLKAKQGKGTQRYPQGRRKKR